MLGRELSDLGGAHVEFYTQEYSGPLMAQSATWQVRGLVAA